MGKANHHLHEVLKNATNKPIKPIRLEWDVHDKTQFELNFYYALGSSIKKSRERIYDVKMTYFLPHSIGLTKENYRASDFYGHMFTFQMIETAREAHGPEQIVVKSLEELLASSNRSNQDLPDCSKAIYDTKLFGCIIDGQFDELGKEYKKNFKKKAPGEELRARFQDVLDRIHFFRHRYVENIHLFPGDELKEAVLGVDEFLSNLIEFRVLSIFSSLLGIKGGGSEYSEGDSELIAGLQGQRIKQILDEEMYYRKRQGYMNLKSDSKPREKEEFYFRHSLLKKFVRECLYIQSTSKRKERFHRNVTAAAGASLAALWAALAEVQRMEMMLNRDTSLNYIPLVGIAVIVYVFKDRIKDLSKEFLYSRLSNFFPDLKTELIYRFFDRFGKESKIHIGQTTEVVRMGRWEKLSRSVQLMRNYKRLAAFLGMQVDEHIFEITRTFKCSGEDYEQVGIVGLRDSFRFDVDHLLSRLRNPKKRILLYDLESGGERVKAHRTYHVNVVVEARVRGAKKSTHPSLVPNVFVKLRLVLNKEGLVRVDEIALPDEELYKLHESEAPASPEALLEKTD